MSLILSKNFKTGISKLDLFPESKTIGTEEVSIHELTFYRCALSILLVDKLSSFQISSLSQTR